MSARIDFPDFMDTFLLDDCILFQKSGTETVIISDAPEKGMKIVIKVRVVCTEPMDKPAIPLFSLQPPN